jgi:hypothetical protein
MILPPQAPPIDLRTRQGYYSRRCPPGIDEMAECHERLMLWHRDEVRRKSREKTQGLEHGQK